MNGRGRWIALAAVPSAALVALMLLVARTREDRLGQGTGQRHDAHAAASTPMSSRRSPAPRAAPFAVAGGDVGVESGEEAVPKIDGAEFAEQYADAICACSDETCVDNTRELYGRRLGEVMPERDIRRRHDAFMRALACMRARRARHD